MSRGGNYLSVHTIPNMSEHSHNCCCKSIDGKSDESLMLQHSIWQVGCRFSQATLISMSERQVGKLARRKVLLNKRGPLSCLWQETFHWVFVGLWPAKNHLPICKSLFSWLFADLVKKYPQTQVHSVSMKPSIEILITSLSHHTVMD